MNSGYGYNRLLTNLRTNRSSISWAVSLRTTNSFGINTTSPRLQCKECRRIDVCMYKQPLLMDYEGVGAEPRTYNFFASRRISFVFIIPKLYRLWNWI